MAANGRGESRGWILLPALSFHTLPHPLQLLFSENGAFSTAGQRPPCQSLSSPPLSLQDSAGVQTVYSRRNPSIPRSLLVLLPATTDPGLFLGSPDYASSIRRRHLPDNRDAVDLELDSLIEALRGPGANRGTNLCSRPAAWSECLVRYAFKRPPPTYYPSLSHGFQTPSTRDVFDAPSYDAHEPLAAHPRPEPDL
ncbi:hypothetical protein C8R46DRAFT_1114585 [Mycena filopes]|nr:hypothetical protein C8R46DRAFT_1114585 [Mycena filopes]